MRPILLLLALLAANATQAQEARVVVVVRHAEKASDGPRDPSLTCEGQARARRLAATLAGAGVDHVYATPFRRTRETAAPAAADAGVVVKVRGFDMGGADQHVEELARELRALPPGGTALVVGHSNTVPAIVQALSGQPTEPMPESEYDRYTVVVLGADGSARVITSRY